MTAAEIDLTAATVEARLAHRLDQMDGKIDDLTDLVQRVVTGQRTRFDALEEKLDRIDERLERLEQRLDARRPRGTVVL